MNTEWRKVIDEMPDSEQTVLIATVGDGEPVWLGYHDGEDWLTVEGTFCEVSHWAPMPAGPQEATR